ncbi:MAG: hypothetical protein IPK35_03455 [Saprospiraceae bacterium]|nr:hypothetical protein [Saprospiraceae bacterium]
MPFDSNLIRSKPGVKIEVYKFYASFPTGTFDNQKDTIEGWFIEAVNTKTTIPPPDSVFSALGDYGCIPTFIVSNGSLLRTKYGSIPLIVAVHPQSPTNEPIQPTLELFPIENDDYIKLNDLIVNNPKIKYEGGLDDPPSIKKMIVYKNRTEKALCINIEQSGCPK